jgi:hypothetical protein
MATIIPYMNPLRFTKRGAGVDIDYHTRLPRYDLMYNGVDYQRGIVANKSYYPDHLKTNKLTFEFLTTTAQSSIQAVILKPDGTTDNLTIKNITPTGWTSKPIYTFTYYPIDVGYYQVSIKTETWYDSDIFYNNINGDDSLKNLVEFEYYDSQNRYAAFFIGDNGGWGPKVYYTGFVIEADGETEQSLFIDQPGNPTILETTESDGLIVTLTDLTIKDYKRIRWQRKCDNFRVNGSKVVCLDISSERKDPNSNMIDVTLKCAYAENNGYYVY